jgi:hypothetical protein
VYAIEGPGTELDRHENLGWKRAFERMGFLRGKAESWVVVWVPNDVSDLLAAFSQHVESVPNQPSAYSPPLMPWKDSRGSQCNGGDQRPGRVPDPHPAEQEVANDASIQLGYKRDESVPVGAQLVHQIGFVWTAKRRFVNGSDQRTFFNALSIFKSYMDRIARV